MVPEHPLRPLRVCLHSHLLLPHPFLFSNYFLSSFPVSFSHAFCTCSSICSHTLFSLLYIKNPTILQDSAQMPPSPFSCCRQWGPSLVLSWDLYPPTCRAYHMLGLMCFCASLPHQPRGASRVGPLSFSF